VVSSRLSRGRCEREQPPPSKQSGESVPRSWGLASEETGSHVWRTDCECCPVLPSIQKVVFSIPLPTVNQWCTMKPMFEAVATDFPFVAELPKREKSKVVKVWESFQELSRVSAVEGMLIPQAFAAKVLDVSRQRVYELSGEGRLKVVLVNGHKFVTEKSVIDYAKSERKAGRPVTRLQAIADERGLKQLKSVWKLSREATAAVGEENSRK
jgi:hypothetical protein